VPAKKEQDASNEITSAPPVRSSILSRSKLKPLTNVHPSAPAAQQDEALSQDSKVSRDLPVDMTDDAATDRAVDAISSQEADAVLAIEDTALSEAKSMVPKHRIGAFFSAWLGTKRGWKWTVFVIFIVIVGLGSVPTTRYDILNAAGVRCSLSLSTVDGDTQLVLPGSTASVGSVQGATNHAGFASLYNLKLGPQTLVISRPGFATVRQHLVLGWGGNPLGSTVMKDVGEQYTIDVHDYVTGAAIGNASANNSGSQTLANKRGEITMTISGNADEQPIPITITAPGYATKSINLSGTSNKPVAVSLAPSQPEVYVADQDGSYDLYSSYVDGTNKQVLLAGTSTETSSISLAVSPDGSEAALVSTRDANYDSSGTLLQAITLVAVPGGSIQTLDHAEQIRLIGWVGSTIIYEEQTAAGLSPSYSIESYNYATSSRDQLATSDQFTYVTLAAGVVYYAIPASASTTNDGFYAVQSNGSGKQTILSQDVWSVLRSSYANFSVDTANGWYSYVTGGTTATMLPNAPSNVTSTQYLDLPDGKSSASVVNGQLQIYTIATGKTQTITAATNATYPLRWVTDTELIYRTTDGGINSDYIVDVDGGTPKLIVTDLIDTTGAAGN
jgi:hypothetical protein